MNFTRYWKKKRQHNRKDHPKICFANGISTDYGKGGTGYVTDYGKGSGKNPQFSINRSFFGIIKILTAVAKYSADIGDEKNAGHLKDYCIAGNRSETGSSKEMSFSRKLFIFFDTCSSFSIGIGLFVFGL